MRIGVFCSGGDAPGMNACVRAVVRRSICEGHEIVGIRRGYAGLLSEDFFVAATGESSMTLNCVKGWAQFGGAILRSSRCPEFASQQGVAKAVEILQKHRIDALVPIGGDGTFHGAVDLGQQWSGKIVGCPGTIDNDLMGTDFTIGFSTAVQTAVDAVDKIRDTAESHERMFLIEVMGRRSGYIAVHTALASQAETVCIPETPTDIPTICSSLQKLRDRGKTSVMLIVAEGDEQGGVLALQEKLAAADCPFSTRVAILGHLQRGGNPTPEDRILGAQLGDFAVRSLLDGATGMMAGQIGGVLTLTPFHDTYAEHKPIKQELLDLMEILAH